MAFATADNGYCLSLSGLAGTAIEDVATLEMIQGLHLRRAYSRMEKG